MLRKTRFSLACLLVFSLVLLAACKADENELFIQGRWYYSDQHIAEVPGESFQETKWSFDRGVYEMYSCCFLESGENGRYQVVKSEGDVLIIELFNRNGDTDSERVQVRIVIDREGDTIKIQRSGPFSRLIP